MSVGREGGRTAGVDLMNQINDGKLRREAPGAALEEVKLQVSLECEELLSIGARIRPLLIGNNQIGWVRGMYSSEHRILQKWVYNTTEFMIQSFLLTTTLSRKEIEALSTNELWSLVKTLQTMKEYDLSLLPYMSAFVTTHTSEYLWHGKGRALASFENRHVQLPDGKSIKLLAPSDHARIWASLCTYREQSKIRVDNSLNALMIVRPWAGKSADSLANDLKMASRLLQPDSHEPWKMIVKPKVTTPDDGWAHMEDDSVEGLQKHLDGMLNNDKHEQLIAHIENQHHREAQRKDLEIQELISQQGEGISEGAMVIQTDEEVMAMQRLLQTGKPPVQYENQNTLLDAQRQIRKYQLDIA